MNTLNPVSPMPPAQYEFGQHARIAITARYVLLSVIVVTTAVLTLLAH